MTIIGIDPGPIESGYCVLIYGQPGQGQVADNQTILELLEVDLAEHKPAVVAIEVCEGRGGKAGAETLSTMFWAGIYYQLARSLGSQVECYFRRDVKCHIVGLSSCGDSHVRAAIIERFGRTKTEAVGTKTRPGPLYGIKSHAWPALAVAILHADRLTGSRGAGSINPYLVSR